MCCFSGPVREVADTKIFARREGNTQFLAYLKNARVPPALDVVGNRFRFAEGFRSTHQTFLKVPFWFEH